MSSCLRGLHPTTCSRSNRRHLHRLRLYASAELPTSPALQARKAAEAITAAASAGIFRQRVQLELPLIGATDLDDWPGGVRQQLSALRPLLRQLNAQLCGNGSAMLERPLDEADGVWLLDGEKARFASFPTADTLDAVRECEAAASSLRLPLVLINGAWNADDDFGFWPFRNEQLIQWAASFQDVCSYSQTRIRGQTLIIWHAYPAPYAVWARDIDGAAGRFELLTTFPERPTYAMLESTVTKLGSRSIANADIASRLRAEFIFNRDSATPPPPKQ